MFRARTSWMVYGAFVVILSSAPAVWGDVIGFDDFGLYGGKSVSVDRQVTVIGAVGAGQQGFSSGRDSQFGSVYTTGSSWFGADNRVQGSVYAGGDGGADSGFQLSGDYQAGRGLWFDQGAVIGGSVRADGNIGFARDAQVAGDVHGNGNISLDRDGHFAGGVQPGVGKQLWVAQGTSIAGSTDPAEAMVELWSGVNFPDDSGYAWAGGKYVWQSRGSEFSPEPGAYGRWDIDRDSTLTLTAGTYDLAGFWLGRDSQVVLDTSDGPITLNVFGQFSTDRHVNFIGLDGTDGQVAINVFDHDFSLGRENSLTGQVTVFGGSFSADAEANLAGSFRAERDIWIGRDSQVNYTSVGENIVPEPAPLLLMAVATLGIAWPTHRWKMVPQKSNH